MPQPSSAQRPPGDRSPGAGEGSAAGALEDELRRAILARDEFLCVASHELLTPLTSVHLQLEGMLRALQRRPEDAVASGRLERSTRAALSQVHQLAHLIEELLDVSRITSGRLTLRRAEVDLAALTQEAAARFAGMLEDAGCALQLQAPEPVCGQWDAGRLDQVLAHLILNAIKYGPGGPVVVRVERVEAGGDEGRARLLVRDHGIGISPGDQERIFGRFERAVSAHHYGGLGLGLWITRQIVEAHGGTVAVASEPGCGSAFIVDLPRTPPVAGAEEIGP